MDKMVILTFGAIGTDFMIELSSNNLRWDIETINNNQGTLEYLETVNAKQPLKSDLTT